MAILADITSQFIPEVASCGSASKCYCITCTRKRATTWRLFAAWRQVARATNNEPASIKLATFCNRYATSTHQFNEVVLIVQDIGNCNGEYAAGITAQIMTYCNPPTVNVVQTEYMSCNIKCPIWTGETRVLTYWYDPELAHWGPTSYVWRHMERQRLYKMFYQSWQDAALYDNKEIFKFLTNSVCKMENGKYKNNVYILSNHQVELPDTTETRVINRRAVVVSKKIEIFVWPQYWLNLEAAAGF